MTREEARHILDNLKPTNTKSSFDAYVVGKAITMAIEALEQEPCDDVVSRNDMLDAVGHGTTYTSLELQKIINGLPSVNPVPCEDAVSRQAVLELFEHYCGTAKICNYNQLFDDVKQLPSVRPQEQTGHCKDCKYFEYDSVAKVDGIPLIVAHEICNKWGDGCKTKEDGYCFLFEPQESEVRDE